MNVPLRTRLACPRCRLEIDPARWNTKEADDCPSCGARVRTLVFPSRVEPRRAPEDAGSAGGEAVCTFAPALVARHACDLCGRYLSNLYDLRIGDRHLCPECLSRGRRDRSIPQVVPRFLRWDRTAFAASLLTILTGPLALFTAPAACAFAVWCWRKPVSILPRSKAFLLASLLAGGAVTLGWAALVIVLIRAIMAGAMS